MENEKDVKVEEQDVQEANEEVQEEAVINTNVNIIKLEKGEREKPFYDEIDDERNALYKTYRNTTRLNNILLIVVAAVFIGSFFLITQDTWGQITGWVLIGVTIAGLVAYYLITRNKYPKASKNYFSRFWELSNQYLFNQDKFSDCQIDLREKYDLATVAADRVYKDIIDLASRNLLRGKYDGREFLFGELGVYKHGLRKRSREVVFVGRHITIENKLTIENRYIINIASEEKTYDLPDDIDDLVVLEQQGAFTLYGVEGADYKKELGNDVLSKFKSLSVAKPLLNINVALWSKKTFCYLSYDDSIVAIPFNDKIDSEAYAVLKKNIGEMFEILANI